MTTALALSALAQSPSSPNPSQSSGGSPVAEVSADLGPCAVAFHVTDLAGKPLYNAKIRTTIRYGFLSKRKIELEAGTNADGRARFIQLPAQVKQPLQFEVRYQDETAAFSVDPGTDCQADRDVPLKTGSRPAAK